ncbi:hypothetical protein T492DRAFT_462106 [Pavlovales sp. CCMP2436]|nr:hypothetical protein T492DRAFT_462106 [Pavlovales sp. CCMP2436]|mmetsp:Transcript_36768/g.91598  ORF Transcript_36768/g.91598 Transcript_36768/m.91598 type:complete len:159 (-) Transcript_36768:118-594(-)
MGACGSLSRKNGGLYLTPAQNSNPLGGPLRGVQFQINKAAMHTPAFNLLVFDGCLCCNTFLYTEFPQCLGVSCGGELLCCEGTCCLRPYTKWLQCGCCEAQTTGVTSLCRGQAQVCCCVESFACPPGNGHEVIFAKLFCVCYPTVACCVPLSNVMLRL